jgi:chromatin structure-remodeling complex subunit RSC9
MTSRQTRQSTGQLNSPQPAAYTNGNYGQSTANAIIASNPSTTAAAASNVRPVVTPSTNPEYFRQKRLKQIVSRQNKPQPVRGMMLPGTGFPGPNIYLRALQALKSKIPEEEAYALHHLVKISHERGDKYRFDQFPGLAEALIAKVIEVGSLFYDVSWEISYVEEEMDKPNVLNGLSGTKNLLQRIQSLEVVDIRDDLLPEATAKALNATNEAALIIRNMVMLHENAYCVSAIPSVRDMIVIALSLPHHAAVIELQHYALEIAEQLTKFWILDAQDPLYQSLLSQVDSGDRGSIVTSLKALGRIAMNLEATNKLAGVPRKLLRSICDWLLVADEELQNACLDFLYLFTGFADNVEVLANEVNIDALVNQLVRLLQYNAVAYEERRSPTTKPSKSATHVDHAPKLSAAIIEQLVTLDEPERSSQWLRTCFEEDPAGEITQIQLWTAYNQAFTSTMTSSQHKQLMPAKDFITNVSTTFPTAQAKVVPDPISKQPKYTIGGIQPRSVPVDPATKKTYMRCCWHPPSLLNGLTDTKHSTAKIECGEFTSSPQAMWEHVMNVHLNIPRSESGKWVLEQKPDTKMENGDTTASTTLTQYHCHWGGCTRFNPKGTDSAFEAAQHIKTHLPDTSSMHPIRAKHNRTPSTATLNSSSAQTRHENFQPQFGQPAGLATLGMGGRYSNNHTADTRASAREPPGSSSSPLAPNFRYYNTATDETNDAAGLPLASVLVLRNLARQLNKISPPSTATHNVADSPISKRAGDDSTEPRHATGAKRPRLSDAAKRDREEDEKAEEEGEGSGWVVRVFAPVTEQLHYVAAHNLTLRNYMGGLLKAVSVGGG